MSKTTTLRIATAMLLVAGSGIVQAQPDLQVTAVAIACSQTVPTAPAGTLSRFVQTRCDTNHQAELSVTIENKGTANFTVGGIAGFTQPQGAKSQGVETGIRHSF